MTSLGTAPDSVTVTNTPNVSITSPTQFPCYQAPVWIPLLRLVGTNTAGETLGTVGAGKSWYIVGGTFGCTASGAATLSHNVLVNGTTIATLVHNVNGGDQNVSFSAPPGTCFLATTGQTVTTTFTAAPALAKTVVWYYEV
jgi:hypothetical protein